MPQMNGLTFIHKLINLQLKKLPKIIVVMGGINENLETGETSQPRF